MEEDVTLRRRPEQKAERCRPRWHHSTTESSATSSKLAVMARAAQDLDLTGGNGGETVELTGACDGPGVRKVPAVRCGSVVLFACSENGNGAERGFR